jgi:hypothetical protein
MKVLVRDIRDVVCVMMSNLLKTLEKARDHLDALTTARRVTERESIKHQIVENVY